MLQQILEKVLHFPIWQQMSKDILNEIMQKVEIILLILT